MSNDELVKEIQLLAEQFLLEGPDPSWARTREFCDTMTAKYGETGKTLGLNLLAVLRTQSSFTMEVYVDASIKAGGNVIASATGIANRVTTGDVAVYQQTIDQSKSINPKLKDALKKGCEALHGMSLSNKVLKDDVLQNYGKLTTELDQPKPDPTVLEYLWSGISAVAGKLPAIIELGKLLLPMFAASAT